MPQQTSTGCGGLAGSPEGREAYRHSCGKLGEGLHGARRVPVHRRSLRVHERLGQQTGVGFPEMGPQQPAQLGVAGIDLRALERQCAVIPLPGGENEISGHI